jgi:magnesium chelatase family protein
MAATGAVAHDAIEAYCVLGELALDGSIAAIAGALPAAIGANALGKGLICPRDSGAEAAWAAACRSSRRAICFSSSTTSKACRR